MRLGFRVSGLAFVSSEGGMFSRGLGRGQAVDIFQAVDAAFLASSGVGGETCCALRLEV